MDKDRKENMNAISDTMFNHWLKHSLKKMWSEALREPLPQNLLDIIEQKTASCNC